MLTAGYKGGRRLLYPVRHALRLMIPEQQKALFENTALH
jgi:hypothetical protein